MSSNNAAGRGIDDKRRRDGFSVLSEIEKNFPFSAKNSQKMKYGRGIFDESVECQD